jgi:hypothetical protein
MPRSADSDNACSRFKANTRYLCNQGAVCRQSAALPHHFNELIKSIKRFWGGGTHCEIVTDFNSEPIESRVGENLPASSSLQIGQVFT